MAGTLSGGEQQMLAIARALMSEPKLLMLDEPSLGLAPKIVGELFEIITELKEKKGITILLVEQNAFAALRIADYGYVLENGSITLEGPGSELLGNDDVRKKYLGG
jgi:branched-chain amino acid transport system ATP-binding protein